MEKNHKASVKEVVTCWEKGGLESVKTLLENSEIFKDTWIEKIKKLIDEGKTISVNDEISLVSFNMDRNNFNTNINE